MATENELRQLVVKTAKNYEGYSEANGKHKIIVDGYNAATSGYNVSYADAWCATFVSFVGIQAGLSDIILPECSCGRMIDLYKAKGRWMENDAYTPKAGDIIMYDWQDNGSGDAGGWPDHVGIVVSVSGKSMKIIEGNISNAVGYRTIAVNAQYIRGYCLPDYASKAGASDTSSKPTNGSGAANTSKPTTTTPAPKVVTDPARSYNARYAGVYKSTASTLNVRAGAGTSKTILTTIKYGTAVRNFGYFTTVAGVKWLFVQFTQNGKTVTGYASEQYLRKQT